MKKNTSITMILAIVLTASLTGCGMAADISTDPTTSVSTTAEAAQTAGTAKAESLDDTITVQQLSYTEGSDSVFTKRDLAQTADTSDAQYITVRGTGCLNIQTDLPVRKSTCKIIAGMGQVEENPCFSCNLFRKRRFTVSAQIKHF